MSAFDHHVSRIPVFARWAAAILLSILLILSAYASFINFGPALAVKVGASRWEAALWPIVVTATLVQSAFFLVTLAGALRVHDVHAARWYCGSVLVGGVIISAAGNGYHLKHPNLVGPLPIYVTVLVFAIPALCLPVSVGAYTMWAETKNSRAV